MKQDTETNFRSSFYSPKNDTALTFSQFNQLLEQAKCDTEHDNGNPCYQVDVILPQEQDVRLPHPDRHHWSITFVSSATRLESFLELHHEEISGLPPNVSVKFRADLLRNHKYQEIAKYKILLERYHNTQIRITCDITLDYYAPIENTFFGAINDLRAKWLQSIRILQLDTNPCDIVIKDKYWVHWLSQCANLEMLVFRLSSQIQKTEEVEKMLQLLHAVKRKNLIFVLCADFNRWLYAPVFRRVVSNLELLLPLQSLPQSWMIYVRDYANPLCCELGTEFLDDAIPTLFENIPSLRWLELGCLGHSSAKSKYENPNGFALHQRVKQIQSKMMIQGRFVHKTLDYISPERAKSLATCAGLALIDPNCFYPYYGYLVSRENEKKARPSSEACLRPLRCDSCTL